MASWKQKAMLQRVISRVPAGHRLNFVLQRRVTHGLPTSDAKLAEAAKAGVRHVEGLGKAGSLDIATGTFYEFGGGFDLHMPLVLWCLGVERQRVVDIRRLLRPELVADVARRLAGPVRLPAFVRVPPPGRADGRDLVGFLEDLGIDYRAPCDARATGESDGAIDFITSTSTLEHIPPEDIQAILRECRRILSDDGLMSFAIDYQDHFSYFDRSISAYNFLRFDDRTWQRYNSALNYQNRLRHRDHRTLIEDAGFVVVDEHSTTGTEEDLAVLRTLPLAPRYREVGLDELAVRGACLVLAKAAHGPSPNGGYSA